MKEILNHIPTELQKIIEVFEGNPWFWIPDLIFISELCIRILLSIRIISRKRPAGITLAWLMVVVLLPGIGALIYLFIGENRLGEKRIKRASMVHGLYNEWQKKLVHNAFNGWASKPDVLEPLNKHAQTVVGFPTLPDNQLKLLTNYQSIFSALIADINAAKRMCYLQFYIWQEGGLADDVVNSLLRARERNVNCRILIDGVGSKPFSRSKTVKKLKAAGVDVTVALPANLLRARYRRVDIRNHRKIAVIDWDIAYTGSQNLVDPRYFKQKQGMGHWIDVMVRFQGPAVEAIGSVFIEDWHIETGHGTKIQYREPNFGTHNKTGQVPVQVVPSGPAFRAQAIHRLLLTMLYAAREKLVITTPYFVPDESIKMALISASQRGVKVTIIVPAQVDSFLVRHASRSLFSEMLDAGVQIAQFRGGLLHTKSITVDQDFCAVGSVNLDMRSFWLNFEISLFIYDSVFAARVTELQNEYLSDTEILDKLTWQNYPGRKPFAENITRLLGPLL